MAFSRQVTSEHYSKISIPSTSTDGGGVAFGFNATYAAVKSDRNGSVYVTFASSTPTTDGIELTSGATLTFERSQTAVCALKSTTTSTSTHVHVWAWG